VNKISATAKNLNVSPRKIGLVAALIKNRRVNDAMVILEHTPKSAARMLHQVLKSAAANAEYVHKKSAKDLIIDTIMIGPGSTIKRFRAGSRGTIRPKLKRKSNVTLVLNEDSAKLEAGKETA